MTPDDTPMRLGDAVAALCEHEGCAKASHARGLCPMHYQRLRKHGSTDTVRTGGKRLHELLADRTCAQCGAVFAPNRAAPFAQQQKQRFCTPACRDRSRRRPAANWFDGRYEADLNSGCWLWSGKSDTHGYGRASFQGSMWSVHRLSYSLNRGDPGSLHVCHRCDTPACVNPQHLFLGTRSDNMRDMTVKGRGRPGGRTL